MVSNITLGQYVPGKSFLHRMDARVKIVLIIAFIVLVFVGQNYPALGIVVVSVLGVMAFSNVPVKLYFKSLRMIIFCGDPYRRTEPVLWTGGSLFGSLAL